MTTQTNLIDPSEPSEIKSVPVWSHKEIVGIASRWLSAKCGVVLPEFVTYELEIADVLGFK